MSACLLCVYFADDRSVGLRLRHPLFILERADMKKKLLLLSIYLAIGLLMPVTVFASDGKIAGQQSFSGTEDGTASGSMEIVVNVEDGDDLSDIPSEPVKPNDTPDDESPLDNIRDIVHPRQPDSSDKSSVDHSLNPDKPITADDVNTGDVNVWIIVLIIVGAGVVLIMAVRRHRTQCVADVLVHDFSREDSLWHVGLDDDGKLMLQKRRRK